MTNEATMRLSDLCDPITVQVDPRDRPDDVYVGLEHIASGHLVRTGEGRGADVQSAKHAFEAGDVLYGKLRPYLDKAILVEDSGLCTTELLVLRPKASVDPRFVVGVVHAPAFVKHAVAGMTGVQHPRTSWNHIGDFGLPALDAGEQTRAAELLWRVHEATNLHRRKHAVLDDLFKALLHKLMTGEIRVADLDFSALAMAIPELPEPTPVNATACEPEP